MFLGLLTVAHTHTTAEMTGAAQGAGDRAISRGPLQGLRWELRFGIQSPKRTLAQRESKTLKKAHKGLFLIRAY